MKTYIKEFTERPPYFAEQLFFERYHSNSPGPILEIGCSVGHLMRHGANRKIGIDIDFTALTQARNRQFTVALMDVQQGLAFKDSSFTSIECQHVIEHVKNPLFLLQECHRVLKTNGKLVVVTPDIKECGFEYYKDYTHISPFIKESLTRIAYDSGFSRFVVTSMPVGFPLSKLLHRKGWLSLQSALKIQSTLFSLGMRTAKILVLVAEKVVQ